MPTRPSKFNKFVIQVSRGEWTVWICPACYIPQMPVSSGFCYCGISLRPVLMLREEMLEYRERLLALPEANQDEITLVQAIDQEVNGINWA